MKKGFTLIEILVVIIIAAILFGMTMSLGWNYIQSLGFRQDREIYIASIEEFIMRARTTNFYRTTKYSYIDIKIEKESVQIFYGTGSIKDDNCGTTSGTLLKDIKFEKSIFTGIVSADNLIDFSSTNSYTIRIEPYQLGCKDYCSPSIGNQSGIIKSKSTVSDDEACFYFDGNICKFNKTGCPTP